MFMAKTILNKQTETASGRFETICSKCDCHFTFSKIDTYPHTSQDRDGSSTSNYVDCPNCQNSIPADGVMNPNRDNGIFGFIAKSSIQSNVLSNVNVSELRATKDDNEFKRLLIQQLSK
jgi:hypothetical protein